MPHRKKHTALSGTLPFRFRRFLKEQRISCKQSTLGTYATGLRQFLIFLKCAFKTDVITTSHIRHLSAPLLKNYMQFLNDKELVAYSRVNYLLTAKKYLAWEADRGSIDRAILACLDRSQLPKIPEYLPRPLSPQTDAALISKFRQSIDPYAKAFLLLRLTGLRISELIDLPEDCIFSTSNNDHFLKVPLGKLNNERLVPLTNETRSLIELLKNARLARPKQRNPKRLVGIYGDVKHVYNKLDGHFKKMLDSNTDQDKPITFHRLRHTFATSLLSGGVSIVSLMKLLGHRRIEMSLRYAKVTPSLLKNEYLRALEKLETQWSPFPKVNLKTTCRSISPAGLVELLRAFSAKEVTIDANRKRNLLKRLDHLKHDLANIQFLNPFPLPF